MTAKNKPRDAGQISKERSHILCVHDGQGGTALNKLHTQTQTHTHATEGVNRLDKECRDLQVNETCSEVEFTDARQKLTFPLQSWKTRLPAVVLAGNRSTNSCSKELRQH